MRWSVALHAAAAGSSTVESSPPPPPPPPPPFDPSLLTLTHFLLGSSKNFISASYIYKLIYKRMHFLIFINPMIHI